MKVLIVAPNASSRFGGESFLPLKYFQLLRQRPDVKVGLIVHSRNRDDLSQLFPDASGSIHYIEDNVVHRAIWTIGRKMPKIVNEVVFVTLLNLFDAALQRKLIRRLVATEGFDVIHQPIPVSPKIPSAIHGFGVPVIIGPMNGGMTYPEGFEDHESRNARRFVSISRRIATGMNHLMPGKKKADVLLVANQRTARALPVKDHPAVIELVENAVDLSVWRDHPERKSHESTHALRLVFLGRLVKWKAIDITLDAVARARAEGFNVQLKVIGDGEERAHLTHLAARLQITEAVTFAGFLPQAKCAEEFAMADALILNSVYECGGAVVLEAMSQGLPVIASDWGGPADYLDEGCGILVPPAPRDTFAARLCDAIVRLAADPDLRQRLGAAGKAKIKRDFDWQKKVDRMLEIYLKAVRAETSAVPGPGADAPQQTS